MTILSKHRRALLDAGKYEELRATLPPRTPNRSAIARLAWKRKKKLAAQVKGSKQRFIARKKRSAAEKERIYGDDGHITWLKGQPCLIAGHPLHVCMGAIECVHVENGGMGRKANADKTVPGCHAAHVYLHCVGQRSFEKCYDVDLKASAALTEQRWRAECARRGIE